MMMMNLLGYTFKIYNSGYNTVDLYVIQLLSILLSILVCAAASLFCDCLVSLQVSAPYGVPVAGSTLDLLGLQLSLQIDGRLLLKRSRCLEYAIQCALILRCISFVLVLFLAVVVLPQVYGRHFVHVVWSVNYN